MAYGKNAVFLPEKRGLHELDVVVSGELDLNGGAKELLIRVVCDGVRFAASVERDAPCIEQKLNGLLEAICVE